ncbi:MAG: hypothetical protein Q8Q09_15795 [Deltaproteobacteria bacterium]|nr:hypothetical protein [Deltaproteobacteria bacterium]
MKNSRDLALALALLLSAACEIPHGNLPDATPDVQTQDSAMDASGDVAGDTGLVSHPACDGVIELGSERDAGSDAGAPSDPNETARWAGNNEDTPPELESALQPAASGRCSFRAVRQRLFRYRVRTDSALRVSTNNVGSDGPFDSTIFVTTSPCASGARVLGCNDDDPTAPPNPHVTLSLAVTPLLSAGTEVIISVAGFYPAEGSGQPPNPTGEVGAFVLTVSEVPARAEGQACDASGRRDVCATDARCLTLDERGAICVRNGGSPGAFCRDEDQCDAPLACDVNRGRCFSETNTVGDPCDRFDVYLRCGSALTCVAPLRGQRRGTCARNGALLTACARAEGSPPRCDGSLRCSRNLCRNVVSSGARCHVLNDGCPDDESCVVSEFAGAYGRCTPLGAAAGGLCREGASECDAPLFCIASGGSERTCRTVGRTQESRCDNDGVCSFDNPCVVPDPSQPYARVCRVPGALFTECTADTGCAAGLRCIDRTSSALGRCLPVLTVGALCDPNRRTDACDTGLRCARDVPTGEGPSHCVAPGDVAGSACRTSAPRCNEGLVCDTGLNRCLATASEGQACDPRFNNVRCASPTVCVSRGFSQGQCASPSPEIEPNDRASGLSGRAGSFAIRGSLSRTDIDCAGVVVPDGGALFAHAVGVNGQCVGNLVLDLYSEGGTWLGSDSDAGAFGCPRIDGEQNRWAQGLSAGTYTVCVREGNGNPIGAYVLSLASRP